MDLSATAALIDSLDVIVSVDTMVAHLAGALGKKVYLLLHTEADWRWLREREDSLWYPTMRLLRQSTAGDWAPVVGRLMDLLMENGS
jgi:ADP-heptose:LPS heptosyltransferase